MSDNNRPLGDYSRENTGYSGVVTSFEGKPIPQEGLTPSLQPSVMFSNQQTPGSFGIKNKPALRTPTFGREITNPKTPQISPEQKELLARKKETEKNIQQCLGAIHSIFTAINSEDISDILPTLDKGQDEVSLQEEVNNLIKKLEEASSLEKINEVRDDIKNLGDKIQVVQNIISRNQLIRAENLKELHPYISRFAIIDDKVKTLLTKKIPEGVQVEIHELISSLDWLKKDPASGSDDAGIDEIEKKLKRLEEVTNQENSRLEQEGAEKIEKTLLQETKVNKEALSLYKKLWPLIEKFSPLSVEAKRLQDSNLSDVQKETLQKKTAELQTLKEQLENNPTRESIDLFEEGLSEYETLVEESITFQQEPASPLGPWGGWPESRLFFIPANPKQGIIPRFVFIEENGDPKPLNPKESADWAAIKTNFDTSFKEYEAFLKNGNTTRKIKELHTLIKSKNDAIEAILSENSENATNLIHAFRIKLDEVKNDWDAKIKKEAEDAAITQDQNKQEELLKGRLNQLKALYADLTPLYERVASEITSEDERTFITEYNTKLTEQSEVEVNDLTDSSLKEFATEINNFRAQLTKIEERLIAMRPKLINGRKAPPLRTRFGTTNKTKYIILRDGTKMIVEDWDKKQIDKYPEQTEARREEEKRRLFDITLAQHKELYSKNPKTYLELYSHKNWASGDINKKASKEMLDAQTTYLVQTEDSLKQQLDTLITKLSTSPEGEKNSISQEIETLKQKLQITQDEIRLISEISYNQKIAFYKNQDSAKTIRRMREVYSPAQDASLNATNPAKPEIRGLFKTMRLANTAKKEGYISEEEASLQKEQLEIYRGYTAEIKAINKRIQEKKRISADADIQADLLEIEGIENKINLLIKKAAPSVSMIEQQSPSHYTGMVKSLGDEEILLNPDTYRLPSQAEFNQEEGSTDQAAPNPEQTIHRDINSPEQVQKKRTMVGTLFETLTKNNAKKYANDWRVWMVACVVAGAGLSTLVPNRNETPVKSPQTLEQMMSWRYYLQTEESKEFAADFIDSKMKPEEKLNQIIKKYGKTITLNNSNPESFNRIKGIDVGLFYNDQGNKYKSGLNEEESQDVSTIIARLIEIMSAAQGKEVSEYSFKQSNYTFPTPNITLEGYFNYVLKFVTEVDNKEKALKK